MARGYGNVSVITELRSFIKYCRPSYGLLAGFVMVVVAVLVLVLRFYLTALCQLNTPSSIFVVYSNTSQTSTCTRIQVCDE